MSATDDLNRQAQTDPAGAAARADQINNQIADRLPSQKLAGQVRGHTDNQIGMDLNSFEQMTKDVSGQLAQIPQNPDMNLASHYYSEMDAPIQSDFFNQAGNVSSYLARQGLGSSGINVAAHSGLAENKAALEGQAKNKALDLSMEKQRQSLLDEFSTRAMALQPELQKYGIDVSRQIAQMEINAQMDSLMAQGLGQLAGLGVGKLSGMGGAGNIVPPGGGYTGGGMGPGVPAPILEG